MKKAEIIKAMREWYMPNFFDLDMFDYINTSDEQVYEIYLGECESYTKEEIDEMLKEHI